VVKAPTAAPPIQEQPAAPAPTPNTTPAPSAPDTPPLPKAPVSSVSLTGIRNTLKDQARQQHEAKKAAQANKREVTLENLKPAWQQAIEQVAADKGMYKASLMLSDLSYEHPTIKVAALLSCFDFIKQRRLELLNFFKNHYSDEALNVVIDQKADEEPKERILSTREVFETMALKNPALKLLKEQLGLDLEL
jgi:hypothetical protein